VIVQQVQLVGGGLALLEGMRLLLLVGFAGEQVSQAQRDEMELCFHHRILIDEAC
jgi:hypothetical protein